MKKVLLISIILSVMCITAACSKPQAQPVTATTVESTEASAFTIITGTISKVSDTFSDLTIKNDQGELTFSLENADIETFGELEAEKKVTLVCKGDGSAADSVVLAVDAQDGMKVETVTGSVIDQAMSTFTIKTEAGVELGFLKDNAEGLNSDVLGAAADDSNGSGVMVKVIYVAVVYEQSGDEGSANAMNLPLKVERVE